MDWGKIEIIMLRDSEDWLARIIYVLAEEGVIRQLRIRFAVLSLQTALVLDIQEALFFF